MKLWSVSHLTWRLPRQKYFLPGGPGVWFHAVAIAGLTGGGLLVLLTSCAKFKSSNAASAVETYRRTVEEFSVSFAVMDQNQHRLTNFNLVISNGIFTNNLDYLPGNLENSAADGRYRLRLWELDGSVNFWAHSPAPPAQTLDCAVHPVPYSLTRATNFDFILQPCAVSSRPWLQPIRHQRSRSAYWSCC
jgi:hypothetical protein